MKINRKLALNNSDCWYYDTYDADGKKPSSCRDKQKCLQKWDQFRFVAFFAFQTPSNSKRTQNFRTKNINKKRKKLNQKK